MGEFSTHFGKSSHRQENAKILLQFCFLIYILLNNITSKLVSMGNCTKMVVCYKRELLGIMKKNVAKPFRFILCSIKTFDSGFRSLLFNLFE